MTAIPSHYRLLNETAPPTTAGAWGNAPEVTDNPLNATHRRELAAARDRAKPIRKAARVATFNGYTTGAIAVLSAPYALTDLSGLALMIGMTLVAYNEFRGRKRMLQFDPRGAEMLGWNQLGLLAMIVVYCLLTLYQTLGATGPLTTELKNYADIDSILGSPGSFEQLYKNVTIAMYGSAIGLSFLFQGGNAIYYFTRRRHIQDFVAETPEWAHELV